MIYADSNASQPLLPDIQEYLRERLDQGPLANPNAIHSLGKKVKTGMEKCREMAARVLGCDPRGLVFNSGASEGISTVFHHFLHQGPSQKNRIVISQIEHEAVHQAALFYETKGFALDLLPVGADGVIAEDALEETLKKHGQSIALVSLMAANNETGILQPYELFAALCKKYKVPFFSDTCQLIGKSIFRFQDSGLEFAVVSGHKLGALPGSGLLLVKEPLRFTPMVFGARQEWSLRGGTQNYIGNETLCMALEYFNGQKQYLRDMAMTREKMEWELSKRFPQVVIVGPKVPRLPNTTLVSYPGIHGQAVQIELESRNIYVTTSSACSDNEPRTSEVLQAMGMTDETGRGMIRISLAFGNYKEAYPEILEALTKSYQHLAKIAGY